MHTQRNLKGVRFGRLLVLRYVGKRADGHHLWLCRCDCGLVKELTRNRLTNRKDPTRSCGCLQRDKVRATRKWTPEQRRLRNLWTSMKQRCLNPKNPMFPSYGGRGIKICRRWLVFENFMKDMGVPKNLGRYGVSIDRFPDNDGDYKPGNCRWATEKEQRRNTRRNINVTRNGVTKCFKDWCLEAGVHPGSAMARWKTTGNLEYALTKPKPRSTRHLMFKGQKKSITEWSKELGVPTSEIISRINSGMSVDKALSKKGGS